MTPVTFTRKIDGNVRSAADINELQVAIEDIDANGPDAGSTVDALSDVIITSVATGQVLKWNGTNWVNDDDQTSASGAGSVTVSATAPASPVANQLWLDTNTSTFYRRNSGNTAWMPITAVGVLKPEWFGAIGNGSTDDTAAFTAMLTYANTSPNNLRSWEIELTGTDYKISSTLTWNRYVHRWRGMHSGRQTSGPTMTWFGAVGGTMISSEVTSAAQHHLAFVNINLRAGVDATKPAKAIEFTDRLDSFCLIEDCSFSDFTGNPLRFLGGAINLHMRRFRTDGQGDHAIYFKVVGTCNISLSEMTADNNPTAGFTGGNGGGIHLDASAAANNSYVIASINNCNFEVQNNLTSQSTNGMIKLSNKPDTSARIMFYLSVNDTLMSGAVAPVANGNLSLRVTPATDNVVINIRNTNMPGGIAGIPNFSYSDAGIGTSGIISLLSINPYGTYIGDAITTSWSPAAIFVGEVNFLLGPLKSHGQILCRRWAVLPTSLPSGTNVYDGDEFVDALALTTSSTSMVNAICTDKGTTGTLTGVTATGSSTTPTLSDVTGLRKGQMITIAGSSTAEYRIKDINASTGVVLLDASVGAGVTAAAVAFKAPTYRKRTDTLAVYP